MLEGKITRLSSELKQLESVCLEMKAKLAAQDELSQENKMTRNLSICLVLLFTAYLIHDNMESFVAKMFDTGIVVGNIIQDKIWMCIGFIRDGQNTVSSIYLSFASLRYLVKSSNVFGVNEPARKFGSIMGRPSGGMDTQNDFHWDKHGASAHQQDRRGGSNAQPGGRNLLADIQRFNFDLIKKTNLHL